MFALEAITGLEDGAVMGAKTSIYPAFDLAILLDVILGVIAVLEILERSLKSLPTGTTTFAARAFVSPI